MGGGTLMFYEIFEHSGIESDVCMKRAALCGWLLGYVSVLVLRTYLDLLEMIDS
jgi:hypothetical protein